MGRRFSSERLKAILFSTEARVMPSHGSLTKAGKVRNATPKIPPKPKKNLIPRRRNKRNFLRRLVYQAQQPAAE